MTFIQFSLHHTGLTTMNMPNKRTEEEANKKAIKQRNKNQNKGRPTHVYNEPTNKRTKEKQTTCISKQKVDMTVFNFMQHEVYFYSLSTYITYIQRRIESDILTYYCNTYRIEWNTK